jgi:hypothetical protein
LQSIHNSPKSIEKWRQHADLPAARKLADNLMLPRVTHSGIGHFSSGEQQRATMRTHRKSNAGSSTKNIEDAITAAIAKASV